MRVSDFHNTVQQIKAFLPDYLKERGIDITKNFKCFSPDHKDENPSASLIGLSDTPRVHCWGCGAVFDLFDLVQIFENKPKVGVAWVEETLKYLANKYNIEISTKDLTEEEVYELDTYKAYAAAASLIKVPTGEQFSKFQEAIEKRQWKAEVLLQEGVGTVSSFSDFREALKDAGFPARFIDEIDLGRKDIFNPDNLIFTWYDEYGRPIGFTARYLAYEEEKAQAEAEGKKYNGHKYNNQRTTGLKCNIFQKGKRLYGLHKALKVAPPLYIFEGQADMITARHHNLMNTIAIAGSNLTQDHVHLLRRFNQYDLVICLDGDETGRKKIGEILEKLAGHRDMKIRVIELPDKEDPDSFLRKYGREEFNKLAQWSAFEWKLNQFKEDDDPSKICHQMIPFIVNEASAVQREEECKQLAKYTGIALKAIKEDLNALLDEKSRNKSRERQQVLDRAIYEIQKSPIDAEQVLLSARVELQELSKKYNSEALSIESYISILDTQKETEEKTDLGTAGFELGPDLTMLREWLRGDWNKDVFMALGGPANSGKSAFLCKLAHAIAKYNNDATAIYLSIDDTIEQLLPRFICLAIADKKMTMNQIKQPLYWSDKVCSLSEKRNNGYNAIRQLAQEGKLIVKDANQGRSLAFIESLISYYQDLYSDRRIVFFLDNFHKLPDFQGKDERVRFKHLSEAIKGIATRCHIPIISSVEYTKAPPAVKPTMNSVAESVALQYDTNFIAHLWSELTALPHSYSIFHKDKDWQGKEIILPRVEMLIDKNKISEYKGHLYFDFWPASSDWKEISQEEVAAEAKAYKAEKDEDTDKEEDWGYSNLKDKKEK